MRALTKSAALGNLRQFSKTDSNALPAQMAFPLVSPYLIMKVRKGREWRYRIVFPGLCTDAVVACSTELLCTCIGFTKMLSLRIAKTHQQASGDRAVLGSDAYLHKCSSCFSSNAHNHRFLTAAAWSGLRSAPETNRKEPALIYCTARSRFD